MRFNFFTLNSQFFIQTAKSIFKKSATRIEALAGHVEYSLPQIFAFYVFSLAMSFSFLSWQLFFYQPALHVIFATAGILTLAANPIRRVFKIPQDVQEQGKIKRVHYSENLKRAIVVAIVGFSLYKGMSIPNVLVLGYALCAVLFIGDVRISGGLALLFLSLIPFLLVLHKDTLAENIAVYVYYFLVLTVFGQIKEYARERRLHFL